MSVIRTLIIDDEPLARRRIVKLLESHADFDVIGECQNGLVALEMIRDASPDLVFLDIQMPELSGIEVAKSIDQPSRPVIIFVTAYDEHAVKAFEFNALDYLLKPFAEDRFEATITRAREKLASEEPADHDLSRRMLAALSQLERREYTDRLLIKESDQVLLVDVAEIEWIEAAGKWVKIHTHVNEYQLREPLTQLESRLDPKNFIRIHRSTIVNLNAIKCLEPLFHGEYSVRMNDGTELSLSRSYRARLRERFGNSI